jgi:myo-inositol-1(or 4)-monophosphatase
MIDKRLLEFAHRLADLARGETLHRWEAGCEAQDKGGEGGFDPVTEADRESERAMRALIEQVYPEHGIAGEEFADRPSQGPFTWSLDPIDGTRSFTCGLPNWVTLIALLRDGRPVLGVIDAPCLDERYWAAGGSGLFVRGGREGALKASGCAQLGSARLSTTDPYLFKRAEAEAFERVRRSVRTTRYGQDGYAYARLAAGTLDLVIECGLKPHDYNALVPVVRASGGAIGDWRGGEDLSSGNVIAAATRQLYEESVSLMSGAD